jgi:histidinol-phosphate/aromatic aminotransferase/cobyric acid decarboxylase-like protein
VIVSRTFSKIYGMEGLTAGHAAARPDLIAKDDRSWTGGYPFQAAMLANVAIGRPFPVLIE